MFFCFLFLDLQPEAGGEQAVAVRGPHIAAAAAAAEANQRGGGTRGTPQK